MIPDIDECEDGLADCPVGTMCQNTLGFYKCLPDFCDDGYRLLNGTCQGSFAL